MRAHCPQPRRKKLARTSAATAASGQLPTAEDQSEDDEVVLTQPEEIIWPPNVLHELHRVLVPFVIASGTVYQQQQQVPTQAFLAKDIIFRMLLFVKVHKWGSCVPVRGCVCVCVS